MIAPRLAGHGTHYLDLEKQTANDFLLSLERGYEQLSKQCSKIFVLGQSMGGELALWLAKKHQEIAGIITVNPALTLPSYEYLRGKTEPRFIDEGEPDIKAEGVKEITYSKTPIHAINELQKVMDATPLILKDINCPILAIKSSVDYVVPPSNTDYMIKNIDSEVKESIVLMNSYHVASMDNDKDLIVKGCHDFIKDRVEFKIAL
ncbi:alpha/beta hydrolase [Oceanobacillus rekensis]|uniref:alpha/beta hydrolase n=1 Tax=Oceanobacillus rekensis TaxID=937927 RepID=UPI00318309BE